MDYQKVLNTVESKLSGKFDNIINDIKERISSGSTGGEIASMVGKYLKDLKFAHPDAYFLLREDIELYILECKKQGLEII